MDPKVIVILGMGGCILFLFLIIGIIHWVTMDEEEEKVEDNNNNNDDGDDDDDDDSETSSSECSQPGDAGGKLTLHCSGTVPDESGSVHKGKQCDDVAVFGRPANSNILDYQANETDSAMTWFGSLYNTKQNPWLNWIVKDSNGNICNNKKPICTGRPTGGAWTGQDCDVSGDSVQSNGSDQKHGKFAWCAFMDGCAVGIGDK